MIASGTRVPELLSTSFPLARDLGLDCRSQMVRTGEEFTSVNRAKRMAPAGLVGGHAFPACAGQDRLLGEHHRRVREQVLSLLRNSRTPRRTGLACRQSVRDNSLTTRYLRDYPHVFRELKGIEPPGGHSRPIPAQASN